MALSVDVKNISGDAVHSAYAYIDPATFSVSGSAARFCVAFKTEKVGIVFNSESFKFETDDPSISAAYQYLKTLPEFEMADDC